MWKKVFLLHGIMETLTYVFNWFYFSQYLVSDFSVDHFRSSLCKVFDHLWFISSNISEHSAKRCISPHFFFISPFWYPPFFGNIHSPSWHPSRENTRFYDDTPESGKLKTIQSHENLLPIETVSKVWICPDRYHIDNWHSCWHCVPSWWSWHQVPSYKNIIDWP